VSFDLPLAQYAATVTLNLALAIAAGAGMSALWIARRGSAWAVRQRSRLRVASHAALAAAMLASVLVLWLEAASMAEVPLTEAAGAAWAMLTATHLGKAWMAGAGVLVLSAFAMRPHSERSMRLRLLGLAAFLYTRSMVSHASANGDFSVSMIADWVHLVLISLWVGEVCIAGLLMLATPPGDGIGDRADCMGYIEALSTSATYALAGIFATGLVSAWINVGSPGALTGNAYGATLLAKLALVAFAVLLGSVNRFVVMPSLATSPLPSLRRFTLILRIEALVLLGVLVLAAVLSSTSPPTAG
jgi:putative copper resistance protein D